MFGKLISGAALIATVAAGLVPATASARDRDGYRNNDSRDYRGDRRDYDRGDRYYGRHDNGRHNGWSKHRRGYGGDGYYGRQSYAYGGDRYYDRGRYYRGDRCRRDGSTGTILGAIAGGLIGNGVAGRGDRTLGTVIGAGGGALVGRSIDRDGRC